MDNNILIQKIRNLTNISEKEFPLEIIDHLKQIKENNNLGFHEQYSSLPAITFKTNDKKVIASSKKFGNVFFNFKNYIFPLLGNAGSLISLLANGSFVTITLAGLGLWGVLNSAMEIKLNKKHSKLMLAISYYKRLGVTINEETFKMIQVSLDLSDKEFEKVIKDLEALKIIKVSYTPFNIKLLEKIIHKRELEENL